jgi:hypothetical protein
MTMAVCSHLNQLTLAFVGATGGMAMRLISARELKDKLDRSDPLKLVNALGDWEYRAAHIPGSLHFSTPEETLRELDDAPQGPGRLWGVHDWREGAVEIQAEGDLARPLGQLRCVLGDRGVGGHGVRFSETPCSWPGASSIVWSWTRT